MTARTLTPIHRRTLGSDITRALREAILSGRYQPGDHLTEAQIARALGVSHGPVREALRELEAEELIIIAAHRGAFVKTFTADDVREIYSLRTVLETAMAKLLMTHVTKEQLAALDALIEDMRQAAQAEDPEALIEIDLEFHRRMCEWSAHRRLYAAWQKLASPIRLFLTMAIPKYLSLHDAAESHPPIVRALRRRDAEAAVKHMARGVGQVGEQIAAAIGAELGVVPQRSENGTAKRGNK